MNRGVAILNPANVPDGCELGVIENALARCGYSVVWSHNPGQERVVAATEPPTQRERIATQLLCANVSLNGLPVDRETGRHRAEMALQLTDEFINALNKKDPIT